MVPKYRSKIFVSSPFVDLRDARQIVINTILSLGHFPIAMEHFTSSSQSSWDIIEENLRSADYVIAVVGGRYGSTVAEGKSFSEREIELARKLGIPVLPFIHGDPGELPAKVLDISQTSRAHLSRFRELLGQASNVSFWTNIHELGLQIALALVKEIASNPRHSLMDSNPAQGKRMQVSSPKGQVDQRNSGGSPEGDESSTEKSIRGLRVLLDRRALQSQKISLDGLRAELKPATNPRSGGEVVLALELDDRERLIEFNLPGRFDVGPMIQGHLSTLPGVLDVIEL